MLCRRWRASFWVPWCIQGTFSKLGFPTKATSNIHVRSGKTHHVPPLHDTAHLAYRWGLCSGSHLDRHFSSSTRYCQGRLRNRVLLEHNDHIVGNEHTRRGRDLMQRIHLGHRWSYGRPLANSRHHAGPSFSLTTRVSAIDDNAGIFSCRC